MDPSALALTPEDQRPSMEPQLSQIDTEPWKLPTLLVPGCLLSTPKGTLSSSLRVFGTPPQTTVKSPSALRLIQL